MKHTGNEELHTETGGEPETALTRWHCDTDCRAANRPCRGEKGKDPKAPELCPYYEDMLF
jgi:hypothetical protein